MPKFALRLIVAAVVLLAPATAHAAGEKALTTLDSTYLERFDSLSSSAPSSVTPEGWTFAETGANTNTTYAVGTGSGTAGDTYSLGLAPATERAFGGLRSGSLVPTVGGGFLNSTGSTITSVDIDYVGEEWRLGALGRADRLDFQYQVGAGALTGGTWIDVNQLDFTTPNTGGTALGARDGNLALNRTNLVWTIGGLTIAPGQTLWFRWVDVDVTGSDDALGVDEFHLTARGGAVSDSAPTVTSTSPAQAASGVATNANITVNFSEPVSTSGNWFSIVCTASGTHTAVAGAGLTSFTLDPDGDFAGGESCTVKILAAGVTDTDAIDPPDNMAADYSLTFTTLAAARRIHEIQGASHLSPLNGQLVRSVTGIVTQKTSSGYFMQDPDPDADPATSDAVFVFTSSAPAVSVGDAVSVAGRVTEFRGGTDNAANTGLTLTEIGFATTTVVSSGNTLPAATPWSPPTETIEDDATGNVETSGTFDPAQDGLDYFESLEAMRVSIDDATVTGPSRDFTSSQTTEVPVVGAGAGVRTTRGGIVIRANDFNPERIILQSTLGELPAMNVGDSIPGTTIGVLDYNFGNFKLKPSGPVSYVRGDLQQEVTATASPLQLSVATFNVENLSPLNPQSKFDRLSGILVHNLKAPDVVAIEEIQDNTGASEDAVTPAEKAAADDGTVASNVTLDRLVDAIVAAGGPRYHWRYIAPENNKDGGAPSGNIRVAFLFNADRVSFVDRGTAGTFDANDVQGTGEATQLKYSPGRIAPASSAWDSSRKPLAAEFVFRGHKVFVIANHFASKGGDDPLMGRYQPNTRSSEVKRHLQAQEVRDFTQKLLDADPAADVIVAGDLNDFQFSETVSILKQTGLSALIDTLPVAEQYTYDFDGNSQAIDHILVSPSLAGLIEPGDYDVVHVNSEFSDQASDHDPQLARFLLNDAPEVTVGGPFTVAEGSELPVTAVGTDTEDETTLTYAWDLDGNGTFETPGQSPTFSAAGLDGPSTQAIAVQVTDDGGLTATQTTDVTIENVAPTPAIAGAPATSAEGSQITTTATSTDPGPDTVSYAWAVAKDGASFASGTGDSFSYTPDDNGTYVVELTATDDDGGSGTTTATTDVTNVNPVASLAGAAATSPEGTAVTATGSSTDAGSADTVVYAWSVTKDGAPFASGDGASVSYSPTDNGTYVVTLTATDDDGGSGTSSATTTVTNVAPTATFSAPARADAGSTYTIALNGPSDPSTVDVAHGLEYAFDCGTGYGAFGAASSQTCTADTLGSRTVGGKIRDKDGGVSTYSATVEVTITAQGLCQLTLQYIQASPKYQSLPAAARKVAEALAQAACGKLAVVPPMTEAHKAAAVNAYRHAVDALVPAGWLTAAQAAALGRWAAGI